MKKLTAFFGIAVMCLTLTACGSLFKHNENNVSVTVTIAPTKVPSLVPSVTDAAPTEPAPTETPAVTKAPTATSAPSEAATATPVPEPMSEGEALDAVKAEIDTAIYTISVPEQINIDGKLYYKFTVSDANQVYSPDIIVEALTGKLYYYDSYNVLSTFESFPPDKTETADSQGDTLTKEEAVALLKTLSADVLGLPDTLDAYDLKVDSWNTVVKGTECYCINVLSNSNGSVALVGMYYVSLDGSMIYRNDADDFTLIY